MLNHYEVDGEYTYIFLKRKSGDSLKTKISTCDLEKAKRFPNTWTASYCKSTKSFYVLGRIRKGEKVKTISLHRWLTDASKHLVVDHIDHDTLNNSNENLRVVTQQQNCQNRKGAYKTSKTGIRGVCWDKQSSRWRVQMRVNGKNKDFGKFKDLEEAKLKSIEIHKKYIDVYAKERNA